MNIRKNIAVREFSVHGALLTLLMTTLLMTAQVVEAADEPPSQHEILLALYNATNGDAWTNKTDWLGAEGTECSWYGVQCDGDNNVTRLDLHQNNLVGSIPTVLGSLTSLEYIDFGGNQIGGVIPDSIAQLTNLDGIFLWGNQYSGSLPSFFGGMTQLSHFSLGGNQFSGVIPVSYGNLVNLLQFDLAHNQLTGGIPTSLGNLNKASRIDLNNNQLSGTVPDEVLSLGTVNLWANTNLTGIEFGDPAACAVQTGLTVGAQVGGALVPFEDCYIDDEDDPLMADFYRLDLSDASDTTLLKIEAHSDFYYPHVGVLDSDGTEGEDIVETQIEQNSLSFEVALAPGEYVLYIHGGSYQPQNVAATGAYTLNTQAISELQSGCIRFGSTWATVGIEVDAALTETDCVTTINDTSILTESYMFSLQQNQSVRVVAQSEIASQFRIFNESGFVDGSPIGLPNIPYSVSFTAGQSGRYRVVMYNTLSNSLETGAYSLEIGTVPESHVDQRTALISLYNATAGDNWTDKTNWLGAEGTECTWFGVQCDFGGNVSNLTLRQNNLVGSLPSELASLSALQNLDLGGNQLSGTIPSSIAQLLNLKFIHLWGNQYTGSLPLAFGEMPQLQRLSLGGNQFSGTIPSTYGNLVNIIDLDLAYNQLSGTIPTELGSLVNATSINLRQNQFSGAVPSPVLALGTVNLWANPNLTGIALGDPAACENQAALTLGAQVPGELTPFEDCYLDDERIMADFYRLDLSAEPGTTLFKIDAYSDHYYPHVGVLDANGIGDDGRDIVDTQIQQNGLSFEVALAPGEYVLYIHGGTYQSQNVAATGAYTLSTQVLNELQVGCLAFKRTWVIKGAEIEGAIHGDDCLDTYNDPDRLYDEYTIWLEQGEAVLVTLEAEIAAQLLAFGHDSSFKSSQAAPGVKQGFTMVAANTGWHRFAPYTTNANPLEAGAYTIRFLEPVGNQDACVNLPDLQFGDSFSGVLSQSSDCIGVIGNRLVDAFASSLNANSVLEITLTSDAFTPMLGLRPMGSVSAPIVGPNIALQAAAGNSKTNEYVLPQGDYVVAATSLESDLENPPEGAYTLQAVMNSEPAVGCGVDTFVTSGSVASGAISSADCVLGPRDEINTEEGARYYDRYLFNLAANTPMYIEFESDVAYRLEHLTHRSSGTENETIVSAGSANSKQVFIIESDAFAIHSFVIVAIDPEGTGNYTASFTATDPAALSQHDILATLYNSTNGASWTDNINWLGAEGTECTWYGVQCDGDGNVTQLSLDQNNLVGSIPVEIGGLNALQLLSMGGNQLNGVIPSSIAQLPNLTNLQLWNNQFNGGLPSFISGMIQLNYLSLGGNQFSGPIPASYGNLANMLDLQLSYTQLSGSIPAELGNLVNATTINLSNSQLTGTVPAALYQLDSLETLNVAGNNLAQSSVLVQFSYTFDATHRGTPGHVLSGLVDGILLDDDDTFLVTGVREASLGGESYDISEQIGLRSARLGVAPFLSLSGDNLDFWICPSGFTDNDCSFGGQGGFLISDRWSLTGATNSAHAGHPTFGFDFRDSDRPINRNNWVAQLLGPDQRDILITLYNSTGGDNWTNSTNWLGAAGTECSWYGVQCNGDNKVTALDLNGNNLVGSIPSVFGDLSSLQFVSLGGNQLSGTIPNSIAQLDDLQGFWLWSNQFSGPLPDFFGQMSQLRNLNLSGNQFNGTIPTSYGNLVNILNLDLAYNQLTGSVPSELGNLLNANSINLQRNQLSGVVPSEVLALDVVNLWANPNLTGIAFGDPAACSDLTDLTLGSQAVGELTPFEDCYDGVQRPTVVDFYRLDLSSESGTTLFQIDASSDSFYPQVGVLSTEGFVNIIDTQVQQSSLSFEVALPPGDYTLYIHGGSYQPQPEAAYVAATGAYTLSTQVLNELQQGCLPIHSTWPTKGVEINSALSNDDCVDTYNDFNRFYDVYSIWVEQGASIRVDAQSAVASQILVFSNTDFVVGSQNGSPNVSYSTRFTAPQTGWYRVRLSNTVNNGGTAGAYSIIFNDAPSFSSDERAALIALYNATGGANWTNKTGWLGAEGTECSWFGVNCDGYGVVELNLIGNGLAGTIPATLSQLSQLRALRLQNNQLTGSIPAELSELENLTGLFLFKNQLSGTIPASLGQLSNLTHLYLQQNLLSGSIPPALGQLSKLVQLFAFENQLSGSLPAELGQLSNLAVLALRDNQLSGAIPAELGQLSSLVTLILTSNSLTGEIPAALGQLSNLEYLYLTANQLSGSIPTVLTQLSKLTTLDLANNNLTGTLPEFAESVAVNVEGNSISDEPVELSADEKTALIAIYNGTGGANWTNSTGWLGAQGTECSWFGVGCENGKVVSISLPSNALAGTIPSSLSQFSELRNLVLNNNQLSGSIPVELAQLSKLSYLSLAANQLSGAIPVQLGQLANLTRLFLNQNQFAGTIPSELGQLSNLTHLYLHQNALSGSIPSSLGQLSNLIQLFVHENQLTGSIPSSLGQLSKMTHLVLSFNSLSGEIPTELGQLTSLQKLFARGNQFAGAIPAELAQLSNLTELYLADNQLSGSIPSQLTQLNKLTILDLENNSLTGALPAFAGSVAVNVDGNSLDVPPTQQVYLNGVGKVFKGVFNNLPIFYNVTDGDATLTGVGIHIYYDSTQVDSIAFANLLNTSLLASDDSGAEDSNDSDNDPSTDRFITIGWTDVSGNWPGSLPIKLFDLRVQLDDAMSANDQLVLNFVRSTNTTGYELELPQLSLAVSTETLDVDGNGKAEALTDGLLIIRRQFGFSGAVLIDRAIADDAVLTTAEAIVARVQQMESILDVDGDGKVEALTDGLLTIRYLFGFRGNVLVANAIGSGATRTTASQIEEYLAALVP